MCTNPGFWFARFIVISIAIGSMTMSASAVTVEVAKKCSALATGAYPPRQIGNPAAGTLNGTTFDKQTYYQKCVSNNGDMDDQSSQEKN